MWAPAASNTTDLIEELEKSLKMAKETLRRQILDLLHILSKFGAVVCIGVEYTHADH